MRSFYSGPGKKGTKIANGKKKFINIYFLIGNINKILKLWIYILFIVLNKPIKL